MSHDAPKSQALKVREALLAAKSAQDEATRYTDAALAALDRLVSPPRIPVAAAVS